MTSTRTRYEPIPASAADHTGQIAWSAQYKAWGEVKEQRSD
ncbi:RHS domain-containing protein [Pseudomonas lundensis]